MLFYKRNDKNAQHLTLTTFSLVSAQIVSCNKTLSSILHFVFRAKSHDYLTASWYLRCKRLQMNGHAVKDFLSSASWNTLFDDQSTQYRLHQSHENKVRIKLSWLKKIPADTLTRCCHSLAYWVMCCLEQKPYQQVTLIIKPSFLTKSFNCKILQCQLLNITGSPTFNQYMLVQSRFSACFYLSNEHWQA